MKNKLCLRLFFFIVLTANGISQTWIDSVTTLYSSSSRIHHPTFMKRLGRSYCLPSPFISIVEDSGTVSLIKVASSNDVVSSFQTIITRPSPIGKTQFIGIDPYYFNMDSLRYQYLFWEEGLGTEQRIMYSHRQQDSAWEIPQYFSPSLYRQQELISTQTSFVIGWNENDSLTIIIPTPDSIFSRIKIATNALADSVHPAISDGMIAWETHNSTSMLRYATFDVLNPIIPSDTIPYSQNASYPVFRTDPWWGAWPSICWMKTENGIGNIVGTNYDEFRSPSWVIPTKFTNDSSGMNVPNSAFISPSISPAIAKSAQSTYFHYDYLVFIRTLNDSNAFIRYNIRGRQEFWTMNTIEGIDVQPGSLVPSIWIEKGSNSYSVRYHTGYAEPGAVKDNPLLPSTITLEQNYPNPFNPSTTIQYFLPTKGLVTLEVFDILGRRVSTLVNQKQYSGPHQVQWNAQSISSGIYFYRLTCNTTIIAKKMLFIR